MKPKQKNQDSFRLRGSFFSLSAMELHSSDIDKIDEQLAESIALAPKFFEKAPLVIDLEKIKGKIPDLLVLRQLLERHNLIPVAVCSSKKLHQNAAHKAGLGILTTNTPPVDPVTNKAKEAKTEDHQEAAETPSHGEAKSNGFMIRQSVRSGQQIYAKGCDLTILSSVSPGAEVLADGNIHIYGALRGRAFAGASGDTGAMIFCHSLEAELVSIAGHYRLNEKIDSDYLSKRAVVHLQDEKLLIDLLD